MFYDSNLIFRVKKDLDPLFTAPARPLLTEMVMDEPLDFEKEEDPLLPAPRPTKR